jgi:hypothetical protein
MAGRISRMFIAETVGTYRPHWTIEDVGSAAEAWHDKDGLLDLGLHGYIEHLGYSFAMARSEIAEAR